MLGRDKLDKPTNLWHVGNCIDHNLNVKAHVEMRIETSDKMLHLAWEITKFLFLSLEKISQQCQ